MSHVDEGALHAYLDGALEEYPAAEAERVRSHLETCAHCRERLDEERAVRDRASAILGQAAPQVEVPTFEELRAYVRASAPPERRAGVTRLQKMSWAASVVLALGTGWLLRDGQLSEAATRGLLQESAREVVVEAPAADAEAGPAGRGVDALESRESADAREAETADAAFAPTETRQERPSDGAPAAASADVAGGMPAAAPSAAVSTPSTAPVDADVARARAAQPEPDRFADVADAGGVAGLDEVVTTGTVGATREVAPVPPPEVVAARRAAQPTVTTGDVASSALAQSLQPLAEARGGVAEPEADEDAPRPELPEDVVVSSNAAARAAGLGAARRAEEARGDEVAERTLDPLTIRGLEMIGVEALGDGTVPQGIRALQRLEDGDTLEVLQVPDGADLAALPEPATGMNELVVRRAGYGWLFLRAPRTDGELAELLSRLLDGR